MAELTISTPDLIGDPAVVKVRAYLSDLNHNPVVGYTAGTVLVRDVESKTDVEGELTLDLTPNADIDPDNTYYTLSIGSFRCLISKSSITQTVQQALVEDPEALGLALGLGNLSDVVPDTPTPEDGWALIYDADTETWRPGAAPASELADNSVVTAKIADVNVTTGKIANQAVTLAKIADAVIGDELSTLSGAINPRLLQQRQDYGKRPHVVGQSAMLDELQFDVYIGDSKMRGVGVDLDTATWVIKAHQAENDQAGLVDAGPGFIPAAYIDSVFSGSNLYTLAWDTRAQGAAVSGFSLAWRITTTGHLIADTREWRRAFVLINLQSGGGTYEVSFNGGSSYTAAASSNGTGVAIVDSGDLGSVASRQVRVRNANGSPVDVLGYIPLKNAGTSGSVPVNLAIGGSSTSDWIGVTWWDDIIAALDAVSGAAVRKVIFDVGIADAFEAQTAAAMNGRHDTLVTRAHTAATSFITTGVTIPYRAELPPTVLAPSVPDWEATWVPAWEAVAVDANAAGRNTFLIDDYALLGDCGDGSGTIGEALLMDGLHLGARGQLVKRGNYVRSLGPAVATSSAVLTDGTRDVDGDLNVNGGLTGQSVFAQREGDADPYAGTSHFEGFGGLNGAVGLGDGSGTVDAFLAHAGASLISIIGGKITGAADGSGATDYATKGQMDTAVTGAKARANHTGTQTAATISDFSTAADARITAALAAATVAVVNDLTVGDDLLVSGDIIGIGGAYLQAVSSIIELRNIVSGLLTKARIADGTDADHAVSKGQMDTADALKMAKASNLSDVANAATAFGNIKQPASTTATGVVELATSAETITGSDTDRAVTPAGGAATYAPKAVGSAVTFTTTNGDTIEIGESDFGLGGGFRQPYIGMKKSGDVNYRWVSWGGNFLAGDGTSAPTGATAFSNIKQQATTTATGVVELATNAETETGSDTARVAPVSATEAVYLKKSLADAKGDLLVATAADTLARLAVGTNGYSLVADSAQATGTKWSNEFTKRYEGGREGYQSHGNTGTTETIDLANGNVHRCVLDNNCTFTFTGATNVEGCSFSLILVQDATGSRTATWPASVKWAAGAAPTLSTAANARDRLVFMTEDGGTTWDGALVGKGFA